ncbi:hypothetical protein MMC22_009010 [Lobaria immixta]|nr:hypothetical protein [Lobaria immixta]
MAHGKRFGRGSRVPAHRQDRQGLSSQRHQSLEGSNNDGKILGYMLIEDDGTSRASAKVVANVDGPYDFHFTKVNRVFIAQSGDDLLERMMGDRVVPLAGGSSNSTRSKSNDTESTLFGFTAIRFDKAKPFFRASKGGWIKAYISTNGGTAQNLTGNVTCGGMISMVNVQGSW